MLFVSFARKVAKDYRSAAGPEYGGIRYRHLVYFR